MNDIERRKYEHSNEYIELKARLAYQQTFAYKMRQALGVMKYVAIVVLVIAGIHALHLSDTDCEYDSHGVHCQ